MLAAKSLAAEAGTNITIEALRSGVLSSAALYASLKAAAR